MAVNDIVDLMILLNRRDGEELEQQAGPEGVGLVEYMRDIVAARMRESDMYISLWDEFVADAPSNRAEVIGALEAMVEGDGAFAERLNGLLEDYNELTLAYGTSWQPPAEEDGQVLVGGLRDDVLAMEGEHPGTVRIGQMVEGLPDDDGDADETDQQAIDEDTIPTRDDVLALDEMDGLTEGEEAADLAGLDGVNAATAGLRGGDLTDLDELGLADSEAGLDDRAAAGDMLDVDARADDMGVEDWADMQEEAGMLADDSAATLPGGPQGQVAVQDEGEDIGGDTYVHGRLLPDEDLDDELRPGTLYDSGRDPASTLDQNLTANALTAGDIEDALAPARAALAEQGSGAALAEHLDAIEVELGRAGSADVDRLAAALTALRGANGDLWNLVAWELLDLLPDFAPSVQRVLRDMGGPLGRERGQG